MTNEIADEFRLLLGRLNSAENLKEDSRRAAWVAFEIAVAEPDPLKSRHLAEKLCESIARARGTKPEVLPVYRQRARDMIRYRDEIEAAPRSADPMTLAKKLRQKANSQAARVDKVLVEAVHGSNDATKVAILHLLTRIPPAPIDP